jgi:D-alanyl-D-alanine carboxypeptidase/D-alanyl-D-alanine-endopeptidase (penicillin-binding protein 4)
LLSTAPYRARVKYGNLMPYTAFESVADAIAAAGVRRVTGSVRGDESRYDTVRNVPSWPARYQADGQVGSLSALAVNDGRRFAAIEGRPSPGGPDPEPAAGAAAMLVELLAERGVVVEGGSGAGTAPEGAKEVAAVPSLTVREIVAELLMYSDNTTAELLVKELGFVERGEGSTAAGLEVVRDVAAEAGLPTDGLSLVDGSGLDRSDRVSCATLDALLALGGDEGPIDDGLAVAGTAGTLIDRYTRSPAKGKVRAKTGSLRDVTGLSGWVDTDKGASLSFSILVNTSGRQVTNDDLVATQRVTEALLAYPETPDLSQLGPEVGP